MQNVPVRSLASQEGAGDRRDPRRARRPLGARKPAPLLSGSLLGLAAKPRAELSGGHPMTRLVLAISAANADAILDGTGASDHRARPPKWLPARAYLAVPGVGVVGECELGSPERRTDDGWALPVSNVKRYVQPRSLDRYGLTKTPRSFRYV